MPLSTSEPIAIVGVGCRLPGDANSPSKLWDLLKDPKIVAQKIPEKRFNLSKFYHPTGTHHGTTNVLESYFLDDDVRYFDNQFFGIGAAEAEAMDPQHRLLLEVVYEGMESSGFTLSSMQGSDTAVYVGMMSTDYTVSIGLDSNFIPTYTATGISTSNASSRVSYFYDWHGPSMTIDTACSSSLVAVHHAVQQLRTGSSRIAVAAGVNLLLNPLPYITESNLNMLSPTGRSRMWDADADGYARGEGIAAVFLKKLSDAIADGDHIHSIIRETALSHDGRTKGITMPSGKAQAALIRETYARAGLDINKSSDRCQFFEAHGTGTPVGDPQEASALSSAFFKDGQGKHETILVGSVKSVVGHTEGTAGLAGLLKTSLAIQHAEVPPNLLFNKLAPSLEPYYGPLQIPTSLQAWPRLESGQPRRASVNSFGFGGTNSHAIVESYQGQCNGVPRATSNLVALPFLFSAASENALTAMLRNYAAYVSRTAETIHLPSLAHTLACKRSVLPYRISFSASSAVELHEKIEKKLEEAASAASSTGSLSERSASSPTTTLLGIFTGQGAQWATMGAKLISSSPFARSIIQELDESLSTLPSVQDRPSWSILDQIAAVDNASRVNEASISQPLCTAVQIVLVRLLRAAGIKFSAVVGHSSGEIGAAYAAGFLSASDAIRVAYLRGLSLTRPADGQGSSEAGAMMAVGTSYEDAQDLCSDEDFAGKLVVAAVNSATSVTISGDLHAIEAAKVVMDEEKKFCRLLRVDQAYHSSHMLKFAPSYRNSLKACNIQILEPQKDDPTWYSSASGPGRMIRFEDAADPQLDLVCEYWITNMTGTVFFHQAVQSALESDVDFDVVVEVGPHPALKAPVCEIIQEALEEELPYTGTLQRKASDVHSLAETLGHIWTWRGPAAVNFGQYHSVCSGGEPVELVTDLPTYPWDHDRVLWAEARTTKNYLRQKSSFHDLLGTRMPDGTNEDWRWANVLKPKEIPWLSGHKLQGQTVYPGTGYMALAFEASREIQQADGRPLRLIELHNIEIRKALAINDDAGIEVVVTMGDVTTTSAPTPNDGDGDAIIRAKFTVYSPPTKESTTLAVNCCADVVITLGTPSPDTLPPRVQPVGLAGVDVDSFYNAMEKLGYIYDGPFRAMTSIQRTLDVSAGTVQTPTPEPAATPLLIHPGMLDTALQGIFAAYSAPGDDRLWTMHAPSSIRSLTFNPSLAGPRLEDDGEIAYDCTCTDTTQRNKIIGDVDVYTKGYGHKFIEIQGLSFVPLSPFTPLNDRLLFGEATWVADEPSGPLAVGDKARCATDAHICKALDLERVCFFFLRKWQSSLLATREAKGQTFAKHHQALLNWINYIFQLVSEGNHPTVKADWTQDGEKLVYRLLESYDEDDADFAIVRAVGENLCSVLREDGNILEHMTANDRLNNYYKKGLGLVDLQTWVASIVHQISQRYPQMNILEVGAGTGGSSRSILEALGKSFANYMFTDISAGFFDNARTSLAEFTDRMQFKVLDIESDPAKQGFEQTAYDVVVAANVLHATKDLSETLKHVRKLLKPGGYLVLVEVVDNSPIRVGFVQGGLPGWWVGYESGRTYAPTVTLKEWDILLKQNGFSGVDTETISDSSLVNPASVFVSQALDEKFINLRSPLSSSEVQIDDLVIFGTEGPHGDVVAEQFKEVISGHYRKVHVISSLDHINEHLPLPTNCTVLGVRDLHSPIFSTLNPTRWENLKLLVQSASNILWLTTGTQGDNPYAAMTVGLFRSIAYEFPLAQLQIMDVAASDIQHLDMKYIAEMLLRLQVTLPWKMGGEDADETGNILWTTEPELMRQNGVTRILRVTPHAQQNDRYNSINRQIMKVPEKEKSSVRLFWYNSSKSWVVREEERPCSLSRTSTQELASRNISVEFSVLSSINVTASAGGGRLFLCLGKDETSGDKYLCLSSKAASKISIHESHFVPVSLESDISQPYMSFVTAYLLCQHILSIAATGRGTIAIYDPDPVFARLLAKKASDLGKSVVFISSRPLFDVRTKRNWVFVHPRSAPRLIQSLLPKDISIFVDLSNSLLSTQSPAHRVVESLPPLCEKYDAAAVLAGEATTMEPESTKGTCSNSRVSQLLKEADEFAMDLLFEVPDGMPLQIVNLSDVMKETDLGPCELKIIDWRDSTLVEVVPIDRRQDLFSADKTYWLAGLAGDVGRSMCDWMIRHGAKHVVMTSRNPQMPEDWTDAHERAGNRIAALKCNLTDFNDVKRVHDEICRTYPPIAGVANGALVLRDKPMLNTDFDTLQEVLRPKVEGTLNLDKLFGDDTSLDWFIPLSSVAATTGNMGQMAYSSANCFQKALVRQRRARGLAGSSMDISNIVGVGYIAREMRGGRLSAHAAERLINRSRLLPMSEPDLHQLFAEAIIAGRPGSGLSPELISGLQPLSAEAAKQAFWGANPKFSHWIKELSRDSGGSSGDKAANTASLKKLLAGAKGREEITKIVKDAFIAKLKTGLYSSGSEEEQLDAGIPLVDLGVDSLMAVVIRTWALQEMSVDLPVLKILGGDTTLDIVEDIVSKMALLEAQEGGDADNKGTKENGKPVTKD